MYFYGKGNEYDTGSLHDRGCGKTDSGGDTCSALLEEELGLTIGRNELGHRYYTEEDISLMEHIRQWKEQGLQLKAIRLMLSEDGKLSVPTEVVRQAQAW